MANKLYSYLHHLVASMLHMVKSKSMGVDEQKQTRALDSMGQANAVPSTFLPRASQRRLLSGPNLPGPVRSYVK